MYTGTLIDELMKAVERAEKRARRETEPSTEWQHWHWYATQEPNLCVEAGFLGVR